MKKEKDDLINLKLGLEVNLYRVNSNLSNNKVVNTKSFQTVIEFFPEIDIDRLAKVESFHKGITKILKDQLTIEKNILLENITIAEEEIKKIDNQLHQMVNSQDDLMKLLERLLEIDKLKEELENQNKYSILNSQAKENVNTIKQKIDSTLIKTIDEIEILINTGMEKYIKKIYNNKSILPKISFDKTSYTLNHGDDKGTGKSFANLIALDLTYLEKTILPCLVHDSILTKNMGISAVESLINIYNSFEKQIFISIDEIPKYSTKTKDLIEKTKFLKLDQDHLAFKAKWKEKP